MSFNQHNIISEVYKCLKMFFIVILVLLPIEEATTNQCSPGEWISGEQMCKPCPHGMFSPPGDSCTRCPDGHTTQAKGSADSTDCILCPAGKQPYQPLHIPEDWGTCKPCPVNYYKAAGGINCTECPNDTVTGIEGATDVANCTSNATTPQYPSTTCDITSPTADSTITTAINATATITLSSPTSTSTVNSTTSSVDTLPTPGSTVNTATSTEESTTPTATSQTSDGTMTPADSSSQLGQDSPGLKTEYVAIPASAVVVIVVIVVVICVVKRKPQNKSVQESRTSGELNVAFSNNDYADTPPEENDTENAFRDTRIHYASIYKYDNAQPRADNRRPTIDADDDDIHDENLRNEEDLSYDHLGDTIPRSAAIPEDDYDHTTGFQIQVNSGQDGYSHVVANGEQQIADVEYAVVNKKIDSVNEQSSSTVGEDYLYSTVNK